MQAVNNLPPEFNRAATINVNQGECHISCKDAVTLSTVLGSCIAACVRDRIACVGGMNHFLLAQQSGASKERFGASARYGAFAMEELINKVLTQGTGIKKNLEIKVFGGGNINAALNDVGAENSDFIRQFLRREGYPIFGEDLGGGFARRVLFKPVTGRAFIKRLDSMTGQSVVLQELAIAGRKPIPAPVDDIELF